MGRVSVGACLVVGSLISFLVSFLKRFAWVCSFPKTTAFVVSVIVGTATVFVAAWLRSRGLLTDVDFGNIVQCVLVQFAAAVATHEVVVQPITHNLIGPS